MDLVPEELLEEGLSAPIRSTRPSTSTARTRRGRCRGPAGPAPDSGTDTMSPWISAVSVSPLRRIGTIAFPATSPPSTRTSRQRLAGVQDCESSGRSRARRSRRRSERTGRPTPPRRCHRRDSAAVAHREVEVDRRTARTARAIHTSPGPPEHERQRRGDALGAVLPEARSSGWTMSPMTMRARIVGRAAGERGLRHARDPVDSSSPASGSAPVACTQGERDTAPAKNQRDEQRQVGDDVRKVEVRRKDREAGCRGTAMNVASSGWGVRSFTSATATGSMRSKASAKRTR